MAHLMFQLDNQTRKRLEDLKTSTGSKTLSEVARRALRAGLIVVENQESLGAPVQ